MGSRRQQHVSGIWAINKVLYMEAPPWGPTHWFIYHFWLKRYPFHIIPFYCCKCTVFKIWINHKTMSTLLVLFADQNERFPLSFKYFNWWCSYLFIHLKPENGVQVEFPLKAIMGSNPLELHLDYSIVRVHGHQCHLLSCQILPSFNKKIRGNLWGET